MLEQIHLQNFKVSKDVTLALAPLTVLAGLNGSGKSTSLQALALLRQSYERAGDSIAGRVHFRICTQEKKAVIAYMGQKLDKPIVQ